MTFLSISLLVIIVAIVALTVWTVWDVPETPGDVCVGLIVFVAVTLLIQYHIKTSETEPVDIPIMSTHILPYKAIICYQSINDPGKLKTIETTDIAEYNIIKQGDVKAMFSEEHNLYGSVIGENYKILLK